MSKVLVLGSGGREHALAWRIAADSGAKSVWLQPGNAGTKAAGFADLGPGDWTRAEPVAARAKELGIGLVVIGPEMLLAEGWGDALRREGLAVVGPDQAAARLETSKVFAKEFMARADVPTAAFVVVDSAEAMLAELGTTFPVVLKLDGLAAGKGVVVAKNRREAEEFAGRIWTEHEFGRGSHRVVVEQFIAGRELSYIGLCDGERFVALSSATDFKRIGDGDTGPNTGGMGAISPSPFLTPGLQKKIDEQITGRVLAQLKREKLAFRGVLYCGLMISPSGDPYVLEFNTRFGDPETQALMLRLEGDFTGLLQATAEGKLSNAPPPRFGNNTAIYVVAAAEGYPGKSALGDAISGLEKIPVGSHVFYSGVAEKSGSLATGGGRVLGVGATATDATAARGKVYAALKDVSWRGMQYRKDIGTFT